MAAAPFVGRPLLLQRLRWPNPLRPPYTQREINLYRPGELGDVVMCMAVVRAIRERNPEARITFVTHYHQLLKGHPLLDRVLTEEEADRLQLRQVIALRYEVYIPLRLHFIDYFAACVGLENIDRKIVLPDFTPELGDLERALSLPRPWVMVCRKSGSHTPNKDWPDERWNDLIARLTASVSVIELGATPPAQPATSKGRYLDLRGKTTQRQYCAAISRANLLITPATSAIHVAAAYDVPTLSVMTGYELPENSAYPHHTALFHPVPCSPCWLRTPCPFDLKCLRAISVDDVVTAALRRLNDVPSADRPRTA